MTSRKRFSFFSFAILFAATCAAPYVRAQQSPVRVRPLHGSYSGPEVGLWDVGGSSERIMAAQSPSAPDQLFTEDLLCVSYGPE